MVLAILVVAFLYSLWGLVSHLSVPPERLADSTVPYSTTARAIFGDAGRMIIGTVVLAGSCASVNVLLRSVPRMVVEMVEQGLLPSFLIATPRKEAVPLILLSLAIAAMMALGMAGYPETEIYTRGGLYFWLLSYAAISLCVLITRKRSPDVSNLGSSPIPVIVLIAFSFSVFGLVGGWHAWYRAQYPTEAK
jgi:amino acid transporter